ncbi:MAG: hypothetical protein LBL34_00995 [Clostridiales bacterium]|jgi:hypothetical protein|nr:hypothetical protein [Clostridiales bacterium]
MANKVERFLLTGAYFDIIIVMEGEKSRTKSMGVNPRRDIVWSTYKASVKADIRAEGWGSVV